MDIKSFADGETSVRSFQVMRGRDVFVVQSTSRPVNEAIIGLILTITAIRRAGANKITAVIPYYGYSRAVGGAPTSLDSQTAQLVVASNQAHLAPGLLLDEEEDAMEDAPLSVFGSQGTVAARPISAADVATLLEEAGVDMVITVDLQPPGRGQIEVSSQPQSDVGRARNCCCRGFTSAVRLALVTLAPPQPSLYFASPRDRAGILPPDHPCGDDPVDVCRARAGLQDGLPAARRGGASRGLPWARP